MKKYSMEFSVGIFVLLGLLCLGYLTIKLGKMEVFASKDRVVDARFTSVTGLRVGAGVEISGGSVGKVSQIVLNKDQDGALVTMHVRPDINLTDDTIASIKTSGLIGDKYVSLSLGGGDPLKQGATLRDTEPSIDIEALIAKYVFGGIK